MFPFVFLIASDPSLKKFIAAAAVAIGACSSLSLIFVPKIYNLILDKKVWQVYQPGVKSIEVVQKNTVTEC